MITKKLLATAAVIGAALACAGPAYAVEKTAIDKRLNTPMDVDVQALDIFVGSLVDRIEIDLGTRIRYLTETVRRYERLGNDLRAHIQGLQANYTLCPHAEAPVTVPESAGYNTATNRLQWTGVRWQTQPTQDWEHD